MNCDTWPVPEAGDCAGGCTIPEDVDEAVLGAASVVAGQIMRTLSGNQVGRCEATVRPLDECGCSGGGCSCSADRVRLTSPSGPVTGVESVYVDGFLIAAEDYRFYPSSQLLYRVPPGVWPRNDSPANDCNDDGSFCVNVLVGYEPDVWALAVHAELTCELVKACTDQKCRIPKNASQVTGQGVTVTLTPTELSQFIPAVAGWVAAVNPDKMRQPATVSSPDLDRRVRGSGGVAGSSTIDGGWA